MEEKIKNQYRQGDVLLERVLDSDVPPAEQMRAVERDRGRVVLAYGEVTGHAHAIQSPHAELFLVPVESEEPRPDAAREAVEAAVREQYLRVLPGGKSDDVVALTHEQHPAVELPPAWYRVLRQSEYTPESIRTVAD
jgi:hypothetical protein